MINVENRPCNQTREILGTLRGQLDQTIRPWIEQLFTSNRENGPARHELESEPDSWILTDLAPDRITLLHQLFPDFDPENPMVESSVPNKKIQVKMAIDFLELTEPQIITVPLATHLDLAVDIAQIYKDHAEPRGKEVYINRYTENNFTTSDKHIDPRDRKASPPRIRFTDAVSQDEPTSSTITINNAEVLRGILAQTVHEDPKAAVRIYWDPKRDANAPKRRIAGIRLMEAANPAQEPAIQIEVDEDPTTRGKHSEVKMFAHIPADPSDPIRVNDYKELPYIFEPIIAPEEELYNPELFLKLDKLQEILGYPPGVIEYMIQDGKIAFVTDFDPDVNLEPNTVHMTNPPRLTQIRHNLLSRPVLDFKPQSPGTLYKNILNLLQKARLGEIQNIQARHVLKNLDFISSPAVTAQRFSIPLTPSTIRAVRTIAEGNHPKESLQTAILYLQNKLIQPEIDHTLNKADPTNEPDYTFGESISLGHLLQNSQN